MQRIGLTIGLGIALGLGACSASSLDSVDTSVGPIDDDLALVDSGTASADAAGDPIRNDENDAAFNVDTGADSGPVALTDSGAPLVLDSGTVIDSGPPVVNIVPNPGDPYWVDGLTFVSHATLRGLTSVSVDTCRQSPPACTSEEQSYNGGADCVRSTTKAVLLLTEADLTTDANGVSHVCLHEPGTTTARDITCVALDASKTAAVGTGPLLSGGHANWANYLRESFQIGLEAGLTGLIYNEQYATSGTVSLEARTVVLSYTQSVVARFPGGCETFNGRYSNLKVSVRGNLSP